jgi:hypothetical protein
MKKYMLAVSIASGALFALSAQAAPLSSQPSVVKTEVATGDAVQKVWWHGRYRSHWRWGSRGWGWGWGWHRHHWHHWH